MAGRPTLVRADWVIAQADQPALRKAAILIRDGVIAAIGPARDISAPEDAELVALGAAVVVPGLVNAHQHGRGISQILMGYPDMALEPWIAARRKHGAPDIHAVTRLAAEAMLAHGVTATLHANYTYATGDYAQELAAQIAGYRDAGLRATVCVGLQDRGHVVYPDADEAAFIAALPQPARSLFNRAATPPYMPDWAASHALMDRLQAACDGDDLIRLAWGPAGPQWVSDHLWRAIAVDAGKRNIGVHFHVLESPAQAHAATHLYPGGTLAHLRALGVFEGPASCAHAVHMTEADMRIAADEGLVVVLNPGSNMRLFNGPPPVASLRDAGVRLALGTDNCALNDDEDLLAELRLAAALGRVGGIGSGRADARDMLRIATQNGAEAIFRPDQVGLLAPGRPADLAAFALDGSGGATELGFDMLNEQLVARGRPCILTMVAGHIRFANRPEDHARLHNAQGAAMESVIARAHLADDAQIAGLQNALQAHYARRRAQVR